MAKLYNLKSGVAELGQIADGYSAAFPAINHWWVDPTNGSNANSGKAPDSAFATMTQMVSILLSEGSSGDVVFVLPGTLEEAVSVTDYSTYPSYVKFIGLGTGMMGPYWTSGAAASPCLVAGAVGWEFRGIRFACPTSAAAVVVPCTQGTYGANAIGIRTIFRNCYFDGLTTGLYGIDLHGAPYNVEIRDCAFAFIQNASNNAFAIVSSNTSYADAYRAVIDGCWFHECDNFIDASLNVSRVTNNWFQPKGVYDASIILDLRLGTQGENMVAGNHFGDADYSNTGGLYANGSNPGSWSGNFSEDTAEDEVGDNGLTIAPPAA